MVEPSAWNGVVDQVDDALRLYPGAVPKVAVASNSIGSARVIGAAAMPAPADGTSPRRRIFLLEPLGMWMNEDGSLQRHQTPQQHGTGLPPRPPSAQQPSLSYCQAGPDQQPFGQSSPLLDLDRLPVTLVPTSAPVAAANLGLQMQRLAPQASLAAHAPALEAGRPCRTLSLPIAPIPQGDRAQQAAFESDGGLRFGATSHGYARLSDDLCPGSEACFSAPSNTLGCAAQGGLLDSAGASPPPATAGQTLAGALAFQRSSSAVAHGTIWPGLQQQQQQQQHPDAPPRPDGPALLEPTASLPGAAAAALWNQWAQGGEVLVPEHCGHGALSAATGLSGAWSHLRLQSTAGRIGTGTVFRPGAAAAAQGPPWGFVGAGGVLPPHCAAQALGGEAAPPSCWADGGAEVWQAAFGEPAPGAIVGDGGYGQLPGDLRFRVQVQEAVMRGTSPHHLDHLRPQQPQPPGTPNSVPLV